MTRLSTQQKASIAAAIAVGVGGSALANIVTDRSSRRGRTGAALLWSLLFTGAGIYFFARSF